MINNFRNEYFFLSNFYPCEITYDNITYPSVEHYYVAHKSNTTQIINNKSLSDIEYKKYISSVKNASFVKKIGSDIKIRSDWENIKKEVMYNGLKIKFEDDILKNKLKDTKELYIKENNLWHDNFYGSCICSKCNDKGKNILGKLLMKIRKELNEPNKGIII